jgi:hypothetical protein
MEQFSINKFFSSFFQIVPWMKNIRFFIGVVVILVVITTVYKAWFAKTDSNSNRHTIITLPGSHIDTVTQTTEQKTEVAKKSSWWVPHLYSSVAGGIRSKYDGAKTFDSFETEVRVDIIGLRWDWN